MKFKAVFEFEAVQFKGFKDISGINGMMDRESFTNHCDKQLQSGECFDLFPDWLEEEIELGHFYVDGRKRYLRRDDGEWIYPDSIILENYLIVYSFKTESVEIFESLDKIYKCYEVIE